MSGRPSRSGTLSGGIIGRRQAARLGGFSSRRWSWRSMPRTDSRCWSRRRWSAVPRRLRREVPCAVTASRTLRRSPRRGSAMPISPGARKPSPKRRLKRARGSLSEGVALPRVGVREARRGLLDGGLQRAEPRLAAHRAGDELVERGPRERVVDHVVAGEEARRARAVGDGVERRHARPGDHREVLAERGERHEDGRRRPRRPLRGGDPALGQHAVAPEEHAEALGEGVAAGVGGAAAVHHGFEGREGEGDHGAAEEAAEHGASIESLHGVPPSGVSAGGAARRKFSPRATSRRRARSW